MAWRWQSFSNKRDRWAFRSLPLLPRGLITKQASYACCAVRANNVRAGVFGDIDIDDHRAWEEKVCAAAAIKACLPLWKTDRHALLEEFLELGFCATIVALKADALGPEFLGRQLSPKLVNQFADEGIDASGENGEYHTVVTDGPLYAYPLQLEPQGSLLRDGYWFLDLQIKSD